ncbi:MAG: hypothetical protein WC768_01670 [Patescibacteria group bacterium]|jgi:hypothetical protein
MITTATTTLMDLANVFNTPGPMDVANQAADSGKELWFSFLGINWTTPTWDVVILLFIIISVLIYSFTLGRDRIVAILISTYLALAVTTNLPFMDNLDTLINKPGVFGFQVSAFLIVFALLFIFLSRSSLTQNLSSLSGGWWQVILFSLLQVGLLASIILSFLPEVATNYLSPFTKTIFLSDLGKFCWIVLPILALVFFKGRGGSKFDFR